MASENKHNVAVTLWKTLHTGASSQYMVMFSSVGDAELILYLVWAVISLRNSIVTGGGYGGRICRRPKQSSRRECTEGGGSRPIDVLR